MFQFGRPLGKRIGFYVINLVTICITFLLFINVNLEQPAKMVALIGIFDKVRRKGSGQGKVVVSVDD